MTSTDTNPADRPAPLAWPEGLVRDGHMLRLPNGTQVSAAAINVVVAMRNRRDDGDRPVVLIETPRGHWKCPAHSWNEACELRDVIAAIAAEYGPPPETSVAIPYPAEGPA